MEKWEDMKVFVKEEVEGNAAVTIRGLLVDGREYMLDRLEEEFDVRLTDDQYKTLLTQVSDEQERVIPSFSGKKVETWRKSDEVQDMIRDGYWMDLWQVAIKRQLQDFIASATADTTPNKFFMVFFDTHRENLYMLDTVGIDWTLDWLGASTRGVYPVMKIDASSDLTQEEADEKSWQIRTMSWTDFCLTYDDDIYRAINIINGAFLHGNMIEYPEDFKEMMIESFEEGDIDLNESDLPLYHWKILGADVK